MKKVVDSNYLQTETLRTYFAKSPTNCVVLTDYAAMEAYKGDTLSSIYRSMEIVAEYPKRVIVLKPTGKVCGLRGRRSGLQRRMIDEEQTRGFATWCQRLKLAKQGNVSLQQQLLNHGRVASDQMDRIRADVSTYAENLEGAAKGYTPNELKALRTSEPFTEELIDKIVKNTLNMAATMFAGHPQVVKLPPGHEVANTFIFRVALCYYLLALRWISQGGYKDAKLDRLRNDMVDVNFAAFGTFFDGLLTNDTKATEIYLAAKFWLKQVYA
jgi:hypothetical protein